MARNAPLTDPEVEPHFSRPQRRMGAVDAPVRLAMLDAAEIVLREEGYAALTSRRVAERTGVKQRLVYYYFATMDDLAVATFRRLAERELARLDEALASAAPLHGFWETCVDTSDARLVAEFMALANRSDALRGEVVSFIEEARRRQAKALTGALGNAPLGLEPEAAALVATGLALAMNREAALGVEAGHDAAKAAIARLLASEPVAGPM